MTDKLILESVAHFQNEFQLAQEKFSGEGTLLEDRAHYLKMSLSQVNLAFDMIHKGAQITADFFASCEMIVLSLDSICRPLLEQNPGYEAVKAVVNLISDVNATVADTSTDFSVSLNGSTPTDIGTIQPIASMEALVIQKFWESYCHRMPEYAEEQKQAEAERKRMKAEEDRKKEDEQHSVQAQKDSIRMQEEQNKKLRGHAKLLSEKHLRLVEQFEAQLEAKIRKNTEQRRKELIQEKQQLERALLETKTALEGLGLFKFGERKALREQIEALEIQITKISNPQYGMDIIEKQKIAAKNAVSAYRDKVNKFCSDFLSVKTVVMPMPRVKPSADEEAILSTMTQGEFYASEDLLFGAPVQVLTTLVSNGYLQKKAVKGRSFYALADQEPKISYEIVSLNEKIINSPCPQPPSVESILK